MSIKMIQDRLDSYGCRTELEEEHAIREITQEVILAALGRTDFFKLAAFQGGTCLRIFYGLNRFSEDMDFILKRQDGSFRLEPHLKAVSDELLAYGYNIEIADRSNTDIAVQKAFLKDDSIGKVVRLSRSGGTGPLRKIRIRIEIDANPPDGSKFEVKYVDFPFVSSVTVQDKGSLFAGKAHALLCREYIKGRDWYDFLWYTSRGSPINCRFLASAIDQQGPWQGRNIQINLNWCKEQLRNKIISIDWTAAKEDVRRFVKTSELPSIDLWCTDLFLAQLEKMK
jgi:hypothetical protein